MQIACSASATKQNKTKKLLKKERNWPHLDFWKCLLFINNFVVFMRVLCFDWDYVGLANPPPLKNNNNENKININKSK